MSAIIACHIQENHIASGYSLQFGFFQQNQKPHTGLRQENLPHVLARFLALRLWDGHAMSMCDVCSWKWLLTKQALDLQYLADEVPARRTYVSLNQCSLLEEQKGGNLHHVELLHERLGVTVGIPDDARKTNVTLHVLSQRQHRRKYVDARLALLGGKVDHCNLLPRALHKELHVVSGGELWHVRRGLLALSCIVPKVQHALSKVLLRPLHTFHLPQELLAAVEPQSGQARHALLLTQRARLLRLVPYELEEDDVGALARAPLHGVLEPLARRQVHNAILFPIWVGHLGDACVAHHLRRNLQHHQTLARLVQFPLQGGAVAHVHHP
mmetsp:Transcript_44182/g.84455  ORF Transcript_44182/g.84455 Transcript_44182/m.84455 type:complete len:326 (-) Transcript_44182:447-1424(-)